MLYLYPVEKSEGIKVLCQKCRRPIDVVRLDKESKIDGLFVLCKRCGTKWRVKTE